MDVVALTVSSALVRALLVAFAAGQDVASHSGLASGMH